MSARGRISAGFGPPKDLVALRSEAIVTSLPLEAPTGIEPVYTALQAAA